MFSINDFLGLDLITWYKNLTDSDIPAERPIEYVSVNDLPLDDFIRKNEMVISIATPYVKDECLMHEFIQGLINAEASIFLLAIPGDEMSLSENNRRLAEKGGLPILLIPWDVRFADIFETVLGFLHQDYNNAVKKVEGLQEDMLKSFLNGTDLKAASQIISKYLDCKVSITDCSGNALDDAPRAADMTSIPLKSNGHLYGHIHINTVTTQELLDLLSHTLSPLLSLWFYRDEIIERTQSMAKEDLIWMLANGSDPGSEKVTRTAKLMGMNLNRTYACIVGRVHLEDNPSNDWQEKWMDSNINTVRNTFIKTAASLGKDAMMTHHNNAIITYLEISPASGKTQISKFLDIAEEQLKKTSKKLIFSWGISEIKEGPTDYRNYYLHAKLAEELCTANFRYNKRYYYENTLIYNMMSTLSSDENFMKITYDILTPILQYDKTKRTKLMETLRVYLTCKNISEVARRLGRHRQSLLYQLDKIEDLTGLSLKNSDELFLLEVCVRLHVDLSSYK